MKGVALALIKGNRLAPGVEEDGGEAARARIFFGEAKQRPAYAAAANALIDHEIVDMQVRSARQRVDRAHAKHANELIVAKGTDQLIAGEGLPLHAPQELRFVERATQLRDDWEGLLPFRRNQTPD